MRRILAMALLVLLAACSAPDHGTIYEKRYEAPYSWIDYQCVSYNKQGICTLRMPFTHYVPEYWYLCLRLGEDGGCRSVDQVTFHEYEVGEEYP